MERVSFVALKETSIHQKKHHQFSDVDYKPFHHVGDCHCTSQPEVRLAPKSENNKLAKENYNAAQEPAARGRDQAGHSE